MTSVAVGARFSHVALNCRNLLETERWYHDALGFERARVVDLGDGAQIVFLALGGTYLELFSGAEGPRGEPSADGPHEPGALRHVAFQVDDIDAVLDRLRRSGVEPEVTLGPLSFDSFIRGWRTVWVKDPDGAVVEISQGYRDEDVPPTCPHPHVQQDTDQQTAGGLT